MAWSSQGLGIGMTTALRASQKTAHLIRQGALALALVSASAGSVAATTLQAQTAAAFDRYVQESKRQAAPSLDDPAGFLWIDREKDAADLAAVRSGKIVVRRVEIRIDGTKIEVPDGLIHHWIGVVFVPGVTVDDAVSLLQDYDRHELLFGPAVAGSRLVARNDDVFRVWLRFKLKRIITVVVNSDHQAQYSRPDRQRAYSSMFSTRIAQVEHPDTPDERELPVGEDGGYLWRFNTNWRFMERDGGTYLQCESLTLTRNIPVMVRPLIKPFLTSVPRDGLTSMLAAARTALLKKPK
jgi:hypothetical protein